MARGTDSLEALQARYLELTREELPARAKAENWVIKFNHCFMRVLLDHLFGGTWYDHLGKSKPAYNSICKCRFHAPNWENECLFIGFT